MLASESFLFDPRPAYPFLVTAKRYWDPDSADVEDSDALTLVFAHGTGFHKEQWEPTIEELYDFIKGTSVRIREVWSIDAPNHGDAAILNEKELMWGYDGVFGWEEYARCIHAFLAGLGKGVDIDFPSRKLVGIGHSMGAISLILTHGYFPLVKFSALVLVEPMLMTKWFMETKHLGLGSGASNRRDIWPSKEEAYKIMKSKSFKHWDDRVLRIYVEQGLRPLPTAIYPELTEGVTLKCPRSYEAACYRDRTGHPRAYRMLKHITPKVPTHFIYGSIDDQLPRAVQEDVIKYAAGGEQMLASLSKVEGAGHLVVQIDPKGLGRKICNALQRTNHARL
ncbi:hypothetical protein AMATHDRAFT_149724 [Amanita thiersii Skay4041]|uniref:AB hydrolase-1 domain-containing protein n=1 Tax=Amanita thiersii Skay4041 TaxID=703135 RepID=A0A2A9NGS6_9AGAR|nr:hypothetical protein AMATHDRAFT_149724 [Amanita thiersii Skay4041]